MLYILLNFILLKKVLIFFFENNKKQVNAKCYWKTIRKAIKKHWIIKFFLKIVFIKFCKRLVMGAFFARSAACE